jgi:transcriptional regulator with XRE-family HTH domain
LVVLGSRVRERRTALGFSQENLAHRAGVSLNAVHKLEAGRITDPHFSTLSGIARALDTTVAELVGEEVRPKVLRPRSREELLSNAGISSRWLLMDDEAFRDWWLGVSHKEVQQRFRAIENEYRVLEDAFNEIKAPESKITPELKAELRKTQRQAFLRRLAAIVQAPSVDESVEEFYARQRDRKRRHYNIFEESEAQDARAG